MHPPRPHPRLGTEDIGSIRALLARQRQLIDSLQRQLDDQAATIDQLEGRSPSRDRAGLVAADGHELLADRPRRFTDPTGEQPPAAAPRRDRRAFLRGGAAAAGAVAGASALSAISASPAAAVDGDYVQLAITGQTATKPTGIGMTGSPVYGFGVFQSGLDSYRATAAIAGHTDNQFQCGVFGEAHGPYNSGVAGWAAGGAGMHAISDTGDGIEAQSAKGNGAKITADEKYALHIEGRQAAIFFDRQRAKVDPPKRTDAHVVGELEIGPDGGLWSCTAPGSPGTWRHVTGPDTAGSLHVLTSTKRIYDSRPFPPADNGTEGTFSAGEERTINAAYLGAVPAGATAVMVNLTAVASSATGFLAAFRNGTSWPGNSNLNWDHQGATVANLAVVALDAAARFRLKASNPLDVIVDVVGYYR